MNRKFMIISWVVMLSLSAPVLAAGSCTVRSAPARAVLLELFTSEGCSSCPAADRWVSGLTPGVFASAEVVPLAFHVDYWDHLGWHDPFGDKVYTARQYAYTKMRDGAFVFTPQILLQGQNYRGWAGSSRFQPDLRKALALPPGADLQLEQQPAVNGTVGFVAQARLKPGVQAADWKLYVALFQNGIDSRVLRGENGGSMLHHDFVVRSFLVSANGPDANGRLHLRDRFKLPAGAKQEQLGIAVFVQDTKRGAVLQAMAAPLCM